MHENALIKRPFRLLDVWISALTHICLVTMFPSDLKSLQDAEFLGQEMELKFAEQDVLKK